MKRLHRRPALGVLAGLLAAGLAAPGWAAPPQDSQSSGLYGENMRDTLAGDAPLQAVLRQYGITRQLQVELLVEPDGQVAKAGMARDAAPPDAENAIVDALLSLRFGPFFPDMPDKALVFLLPLAPAPAGSGTAAAFRMTSIALYEPQSVLEARLASAAPLEAYIRQLADRLSAVLAAAPAAQGASAALVVGVKPGYRTRFWVVDRPGALPAALVQKLQAAAAEVPAIPVHGGPIAFAILFDAWGGGAPVTDQAHPIPIPPAWLAGSPGREAVPDGVFARIWPNS